MTDSNDPYQMESLLNISEILETTRISKEIEFLESNKLIHRDKTLMLDEFIRMRYLLIDKINDYSEKEKSLFTTPTQTIFDDMV